VGPQVPAAVATVVTLPYGVLVGVLLYLDLRARKERLTMDALRADRGAGQRLAQSPPGAVASWRTQLSP
jgi:hypothetical protein